MYRMLFYVNIYGSYKLSKKSGFFWPTLYLPCSGSSDRLSVCDELLTDIWSWHVIHSNCECIFAGDFNVNLDCSVAKFVNDCFLYRCDDLFPAQKVNTYINVSLGQQSRIDYILVSATNDITYFEVLDSDVNFSDHLPLVCNASVSISVPDHVHTANSQSRAKQNDKPALGQG